MIICAIMIALAVVVYVNAAEIARWIERLKERSIK